MILSSISISNVRNIEQISVELGNRFNIFYGSNGAGKTSILEAIYLLSSGKSFRTHQIKKIISHGADAIVLFAKVNEEEGRVTQIGLNKSGLGYEAGINGERVKSISELAERLPVLVTTQDSHKLIEAGPQWRRQFVDWGLFHVKHEFFTVWKNFRKLLKQRNTALANGLPLDQIAVWDSALAKYGEQYHVLRKTFIYDFCPYFIEFSRYLLGKNEYNIEYFRGWPKGHSYTESLSKNSSKDALTRRTEYGPHRADFQIFINGKNSRDTASRGQLKLLVYALNLALIAYLEETKGLKTLMLLDDLGSELDPEHATKLLSLLWERFSQVCVTTANLESLPPMGNYDDVTMFHVKHGQISKVTKELVEL